METQKIERRGGKREGSGRKPMGKVNQSFRMSESLLKALKAKAEREGTSVVSQLEAALEAFLK